MSASCLYEGSVRHRRYGDVPHELRSQLFMVYLDLDELPEALDCSRLCSARGPAIAWFRRSDHLGDPARPLAQEIRELVARRLDATEPIGPVRLLTNLRYVGHCFNPVSFYYCFDAAGERIKSIVAEVSNTPWGERHAYVLEPETPRAGGVLRGQFRKQFHVSPFMAMDHSYAWRMTEPKERLIVHIDAVRLESLAFDATLTLRRRELSAAGLRAMLRRHPALTLRIVSSIYAHGVRLRLRGARPFPHPHGAPPLGPARRRRARASREGAGR
jgi:DUF1365 family protein